MENFSYVKGKCYDICLKDDAQRRVIANSSMPIIAAQYARGTVDSTKHIEAAYQALLRLEPAALVFEGAAHFLPVWNNGTKVVVNHILLIARGRLNFIKGINFRMQQCENMPISFAHLLKQIDFSRQQVLSLPIHKVLPDQVENYSDSLIQRLLEF